MTGLGLSLSVVFLVYQLHGCLVTAANPGHFYRRLSAGVLTSNDIASIAEADDGTLRFEQAINGGSCKCSGTSCGCCATLKIKELKINSNVCINVQYLKTNIGILLTVTVDGKVIVKKEVSVRNPPAVCANIPALKKLAKACIQLYNMKISKKEVSGCARFVSKVFHVKVIKLELGCFRIPLPADEPDSRIPNTSLVQGDHPAIQDVLLDILLKHELTIDAAEEYEKI